MRPVASNELDPAPVAVLTGDIDLVAVSELVPDPVAVREKVTPT
jgi:hypothetical protein